MADITVFVDGIDRSKLVSRDDRMTYSRDINGQGNAQFVLADSPTGFIPDDGMEVLIKEDGVDRFGGIISGRPRGFHGPDSASQLTFYDIDAASREQRLNKRIVWRAYTDVLFEDIVADLNTDFLDSEGITLNILAGSLITITFNGATVAQALDMLCSEETDGRIWYVTAANVLTVDIQTGTLAPVVLDRTNVKLSGPAPTIEPDRTGYANRVTVVGGNPELPILFTAEDAGEIAIRAGIEGGSGVYHISVEDNEVVTAGQATQRAEGILSQRKFIRQLFKGLTRESGFEIGQTVTVDLINLGIDAATTDFLITNIETTVSPGVRELWHTITAIDGPIDGSWQSEYRRQIKPRTIPMQIEATPGLVRVEPLPGVLIHDPVEEPSSWFQGPLGGTITGVGAAGMGITHQSSGNGGFLLVIGRGPVMAMRESHLEMYSIDAADEVTAGAPTTIHTWVELHASSFKGTIITSPDNTLCVVVERDVGTDPSLIVISLASGFLGSVTATGLADNNNATEGEWVGNFVFWPSTTSNEVFIFDISTPAAPTLDNVFNTTLAGFATACVASSDGNFLYVCGGASDLVAIDISDPTAPVVTDTEVIAGTYNSLDIDEDNARLIMFERATGTTVRFALIDISGGGGTLSIADEDTLPLTQTAMDGVSTLFFGDGAITFKQRPPGGVNSFEAHVFSVVGSVVTFVQTFTYTHGGVGSVGPTKSRIGNRSAVIFFFNTDTQITFGIAGFDKIVPYEIERPLRVDFGGTGLTGGDFIKGDLLAAHGPAVPPPPPDALERVPVGAEGSYLRARAAETAGLAWEAGVQLTQVSIDDTDSPFIPAEGVNIILADASAGAITIDLPNVADQFERLLIIKNDGDGSFAVTVDPFGAETIDNDSTRVLAKEDEVLGIVGSVNEWEGIIIDATELALQLGLVPAATIEPWDLFQSTAFLGSDYMEEEFRWPFRSFPAGAGATSVPGSAIMTGHPGIACQSTGATAAGRAFQLSAIGTLHLGVGFATRIGSIVRTESNLSTALERYTLRAGLSNMNLPNTINFGVTFEYDDSQNGGRWQGICEDGVAETSLDTGITVAANTWYRLEIEVNAGGTLVEFFIDGVSVGTIATNIPTGTGFDHFYSAHIMKLIGTTSRTYYIDASWIHQDVTR